MSSPELTPLPNIVSSDFGFVLETWSHVAQSGLKLALPLMYQGYKYRPPPLALDLFLAT